MALRFLPPFRIRAFDSALNSFSKRRGTTLSKKKQEPGGEKRQGKKEVSRAHTAGLQTGMESKKLRNDERVTLAALVMSDSAGRKARGRKRARDRAGKKKENDNVARSSL